MQDPSTTAALAQVLEWYRAMGVTDLVADEPTNWLDSTNRTPGQAFVLPRSTPGHTDEPSPRPPQRGDRAAEPARPPARAAPVPSLAPRQFVGTAPDAAVSSARSEALRAKSLAELEAILARFDGCSLKATAKSLVFYRGAEKARLMFIGEAPGRDEDQEGKPFVGRAGQLLDKMLAAANLAEAEVHITNIVYWRPPGNRTPTPQEAQVCRPFLERQVELVAPDIIVPLGGAAAKHLLDVADGIMKLRGRLMPITVGRHQARAMATLHPAYLLRTPAAKRQAWRDLLSIRSLLDGGGKA